MYFHTRWPIICVGVFLSESVLLWFFFFVTLESSLVSVSLLYFDFGCQLYAVPSTFAPPRSFDAVFFFGKYKATRAKEVKINSSDEMSDR